MQLALQDWWRQMWLCSAHSVVSHAKLILQYPAQASGLLVVSHSQHQHPNECHLVTQCYAAHDVQRSAYNAWQNLVSLAKEGLVASETMTMSTELTSLSSALWVVSVCVSEAGASTGMEFCSIAQCFLNYTDLNFFSVLMKKLWKINSRDW